MPVAVHDGLEDGGERGDPDPGPDEDCVLGPENLARGGSEGPVDVDLMKIEPNVTMLLDFDGNKAEDLNPGAGFSS